MNEQAIRFGAEASLTGIVSLPDPGSTTVRSTAFVFLNSGILHHVGPNGLHVLMARDLAKLGFTSLRMDFSGIGDSPPARGSMAVADRVSAEASAAIDWLASSRGIDRFVLVGNCSGAAVSLLTASRDSRVSGAILINLQGPRVYLRYYLRLAFGTAAFWRRLFAGSARYRDLLGSLKSLGRKGGHRPAAATDAAPGLDVDSALAGLRPRPVSLLFVYCELDPGLDYFRRTLRQKLEAAIPADRLSIELIGNMNHDFNFLRGNQCLREIVSRWADSSVIAS